MKTNIFVAKQGKTLLDMSNFELKNKKLNIILGESGIGKSLAHKALIGLLKNTELDVKVDNNFITNSFYIFQEPSSHLNPALSLKRQLTEGNIANSKRLKMLFQTLFPNRQMADFLAVKAEKNFPSGGEKQRILVLMGFLAYEKYLSTKEEDALFIFDEATAHLDNDTRNIVLDLLAEFYKEKAATISFITHDYSIAEYLKGKINAVYFEFKREADSIVQKSFKATSIQESLAKLQTIKASHSNEIALEIDETFSMHNNLYRFVNKAKSKKLQLQKNQIVYLKSPSGGGKTSVLTMLMGLKLGDRFRAKLASLELTERTNSNFFAKEIWGKKASLVFQNADEVLSNNSSIYENFKIVKPKLSITEAEKQLLKLFSSAELLQKKVSDLSGGQKQRVNILRTLLVDSEIILFDEPLKGMDFSSVERFLDLLHQLLADGKSIVLVSHMEAIFDRLIPIENHYIIECED